MSILVPLLGAVTPGEPIAWHDGAQVNAHAFVSAAARLAARLPRTRSALLLCEDRVRFACALCACVATGIEVLLPPSHARAAIDAVVDRHRPGFALVDRPDVGFGLAAIPVAERFVADEPFDVPAVPTERAAVTLFTSGSTGVPTAHRKSWGSLVRGAAALGERLRFAPGSTVLGAVPAQHMWGLEASVMLPLACRGILHPSVPLLPQDIARAVSEAPLPRWLALTPIHVRAWLESGVDVPPMTGVLCAAAPLDALDAARFEALSDATLVEIYGTTETGVAGTRRTAEERAFRLVGGLAALATVSGIVFRGGHLDAEVCVGDRLRLHGDDRFELVGRDADLVKIGGKRASLGEIVLMIKRIPGVRDAACLIDGGPGRLAQRLAAVVVAPGLDARTIRAALREHIDPVFLPRPLHIVDVLPRSAVGKLRRDQLEALLRDLDAQGLDREEEA